MGRVLPREKLCVESVPWSRLTRETGSSVVPAWVALSTANVCGGTNVAVVCAAPETVAAMVKPEDFRNKRRLEEMGVSEGRLRSEEHTSELQSLRHLVCRLLLEKKK